MPAVTAADVENVSVGVVMAGEVPKTSAPVPVSSVTAVIRLALDGVARKVATPAASPDTPVEIGNPVAFVKVPDVGVPSSGVTNVGLVAKTNAPVPVSSVTAAIKFALDGVPRNVATPTASPDTPVEIGNPVTFVSTPLVGVPKSGVTSVGLVAKTNAPVPVSSVTAAIRLALVGVAKKAATPAARPETPVEIGKPVAFVRTPDVGVPKSGVTNAGDVAKTSCPVPVSSVITAARLALVGVPSHVAMPVPSPVTAPMAIEIAVDAADVMRPLALTTKVATELADPNAPVLALTVARTVVIGPVPEPDASPERTMV